MEVTFVKTAKASFENGYLRAIEVDGYAVANTLYMDAGREWAIIAYALDQQDIPYKIVQSKRNTKIEVRDSNPCPLPCSSLNHC